MFPDEGWLPQSSEIGPWDLEPEWFDYGLSFEDSECLDQVIQAVSRALECSDRDWFKMVHGGFSYRQGLSGPGGAMILFDPPLVKDRVTRELKERRDIFVYLSGEPCGLVGSARMREFLRYIDSSPFPNTQKRGRPVRVDLALDDAQRVVQVSQVAAALKGPEAVSCARKGREMMGFNVGSPEVTGETVYLGSTSSQRRLCVYDKMMESGGQVDSVRWELRFKDEAAQRLMLLGLVDSDWGELFASQLVSFVDFRDPESHSEVEKRTRLPWYQRLVGLAQKATASLPKPARTVQDVLDWLDRSIGPSLATVVDFFGGSLNVLTSIINSGRERRRPKHRLMLAGEP